eukprot:Selendium_serpulae@DN4614_c0_g1_i4.p1
MKMHFHCKRPYCVSNLAAECTSIHVAHNMEDAPNIKDGVLTINEDNRLLGPNFASGRVSAKKRKQYFSKESNLRAYHFTPEFVYTFSLHNNVIVLPTYDIDLGVSRFNIGKHMNGQPVDMSTFFVKGYDPSSVDPLTSLHMPSNYLWRVEAWSENLLRSQSGALAK